MPLKTVTEKQFLVRISNPATATTSATAGSTAASTPSGAISALFQSATSPKETREVVEYNDGQTGTILKHLGFTSRENVTLAKVYDPTTDHDFVTWYKGLRPSSGADTKFTTVIQAVLADQAGTIYPGSKAISLTGCQVVSFELPKVDRIGGNSSAMLTIEICYDDFSVGS